MKKIAARYDALVVESLIRTIRGQRVILDADLARIYDVPTKVLNQAVRRNYGKFPADFLFQLTFDEARSPAGMRSQTVTASGKRNIRFLPYAFTEHGAIMAANVLNSPQAVQMSVFVVRAFIRMRQVLSAPHELALKLAELEKKLTARLDGHEAAITEVLQQIMQLLNPPPAPEPPAKQIGFHVRERRAVYRVRKTQK